MLSKMKEEVKRPSFMSVIADKAVDLSVKSHFSSVLRYVLQTSVKTSVLSDFQMSVKANLPHFCPKFFLTC
jgi:hypothetical protein